MSEWQSCDPRRWRSLPCCGPAPGTSWSCGVLVPFVRKRALRLAPLYYFALLAWLPFLVVMWQRPQYPATIDAPTKRMAVVLTPLCLQSWDFAQATWMFWLPPSWAVSERHSPSSVRT